MFNFDDKKFFGGDPCGHPGHFPHEKPRYTMTEEVEHTAVQMRETIDRLLRFEERCKADFDGLMKNVTSDNVIFKTTMREAWATFIQEVKNEINVFEGNVDATVSLFQKDTESNYAKLSEDVHSQIAANLADFNEKVTAFETAYVQAFDAFKDAINTRIENYNDNHSQAFADYQVNVGIRLDNFEADIRQAFDEFQTALNETVNNFKTTWANAIAARLDGQDAKISDAEMYMRTNLNTSLENLLYNMKENGQLTGVIESEVFVTPQMFGATGDGATDDTAAIQAAINSGKPVLFPKGVYRTTDPITIKNECVGFDASDATINYEGTLYAFIISDVWRKAVKFGVVDAPNGGCVQVLAETADTSVAYVDIHFVKFSAHTNYACIHGEVTSANAFANEIRIHNGQFARGKYGVEIVNNSGNAGACRINNWKFYNVGLEGVATGIYLNAATSRIERFLFVGLRYAVGEGTSCFLRTTGECHFLNWFGADKILFDTDNYFALSNETARAYFYGNVFDANANAFESVTFDYGEWYRNGRDSLTPVKTYNGATNWDNIKTHGVYYINTYSGSGGVNVFPLSATGFLTVYESGNKVTHFVVSSAGIGVRSFNGETWGEWKTTTLSV